MSEPGIKKRRLQAAHRLRRIILNTDAGSVHDGDPAHPERFLDRRVTGLHETHVDTISFCTDYGFNHYTHNSKVSQVVNYRSDADDPGPDIIHGLIKKGTDTLEVAIRNCHGNGMEIFWAMRRRSTPTCRSRQRSRLATTFRPPRQPTCDRLSGSTSASNLCPAVMS